MSPSFRYEATDFSLKQLMQIGAPLDDATKNRLIWWFKKLGRGVMYARCLSDRVIAVVCFDYGYEEHSIGIVYVERVGGGLALVGVPGGHVQETIDSCRVFATLTN